jgi:hypothetical protein
MPVLLAGAALLGLLWLAGRGYLGTGRKSLAKGTRLYGGILLALLTVALALTEKLGLAGLAASGAWFLLFGSGLPWQRASYSAASTGPGGESSSGTMSRGEALKVFGLEEGANDEAVRAQHRRLILQIHPDKGGSGYLAAKINEAKDVLLRR